MKVLHLVHDSPLVDGVIETFKYFGIESRFVMFGDESLQLKMITRCSEVEIIKRGTTAYERIRLDAVGFDVIWVHYASLEKVRFVAQLPISVKVFWETWGGDYCQYLSDWFYGLKTTRFMLSRLGVIQRMKMCLKLLMRRVMPNIYAKMFLIDDHTQRFIERVDYFSCVLPSEEKIVRRLIGARARYLQFHVASPKSAEGNERSKINLVDPSSKRIWAGNSAILTNNHFDMYDELSKKNFNSYEVYSPLSYGSEGVHGEIADYGRKVMGKRFHPILTYMPWMDYMKLMSSASVFVFWHFRQQSVGNIFMALRMGGCVFVSKKSPVYQFITDLGCKIYSLEDFSNRFESCVKEFASYRKANILNLKQTRTWKVLENDMRQTVMYIDRDLQGRPSR